MKLLYKTASVSGIGSDLHNRLVCVPAAYGRQTFVLFCSDFDSMDECFTLTSFWKQKHTHRVCSVTPRLDLNWTQTQILNIWNDHTSVEMMLSICNVLLTWFVFDADWQVRWGTGDVIQAGVQMSVGSERCSVSWPAGVNPEPFLSLSTQNTSDGSAALSQTTGLCQ